jgi:ankyrin repeat protein
MTKFERVLLLTTLIASSGTAGVQQQLHGMQQIQETTSRADIMAMARCGMTGATAEVLGMVGRGINPFVRDVDGLSCLDHAVVHGHKVLIRSVLQDGKVAENIRKGKHDRDLADLALLCGEYGDEQTYEEILRLRRPLEPTPEQIIRTGYWKLDGIHRRLKKSDMGKVTIGKVGKHSVWYAVGTGMDEELTVLNAHILDGNYSACKQILKKLEAGKVNTKDTQGRTPLMLAARTGNTQFVETLISECKAKLNLKDIKGRTALDYAAMGGHRDIVELLLSKGAIYYHVQGRQIADRTIEELLLDQYFVKDS